MKADKKDNLVQEAEISIPKRKAQLQKGKIKTDKKMQKKAIIV